MLAIDVRDLQSSIIEKPGNILIMILLNLNKSGFTATIAVTRKIQSLLFIEIQIKFVFDIFCDVHFIEPALCNSNDSRVYLHLMNDKVLPHKY